jgi:hypothetical protein
MYRTIFMLAVYGSFGWLLWRLASMIPAVG